MRIIRNILLSLSNRPGGYSFRKLTAITILILIVYLHFNFITIETGITALLYDFIFILALLGLINMDKLVQAKYKGGNKVE
jgi:hypothetical protein